MKRMIERFFADPARARGTARELVLMQIDPHDVSLELVRGAERRSFSDRDDEDDRVATILRANVEPADVPRVEATLDRNGGLELGATAPMRVGAASARTS